MITVKRNWIRVQNEQGEDRLYALDHITGFYLEHHYDYHEFHPEAKRLKATYTMALTPQDSFQLVKGDQMDRIMEFLFNDRYCLELWEE